MAEAIRGEPPALFPVEIACWKLCRFGLSGINSLNVTSRHWSLPESQTQDLQLAEHGTKSGNPQRLLLNQLWWSMRRMWPTCFSAAHLTWGIVVTLLSVYWQAGPSISKRLANSYYVPGTVPVLWELEVNNNKKKSNIQTRASKEFKMWTIDICILYFTYFYIIDMYMTHIFSCP